MDMMRREGRRGEWVNRRVVLAIAVAAAAVIAIMIGIQLQGPDRTVVGITGSSR